MNEQLSRLADWKPLFAMFAAYGAAVVGLAVYGRGEWKGLFPLTRRIADGLERLTRIPGWAAAMIGTSTFGLLVAGMGFYNDVAWHVSLGRDKELFTAPHTAIVLGLLTILASAFIGEFMSTATKANVGMRVFGTRVPYSALAMGLLGLCAVSGFPIDDVWHRVYGIDVTMWSPSHLLMIVGASLSPIASWLALGEAGVLPERGRWATGVHVAVGCVALLGLSSVQGEFAFGVPQFQQLYHPVLYALAGGFALTAMALVVRKWWAPLIVAGVGVFLGSGLADPSSSGGSRSASLYIVAAVAVALVARVLGTERRIRFAVASGVAVGTFGLAGEWVWSRGGYQPWTTALLPDAPIYAVVVGVAASVLAVAFASAVRREPMGFSPRTLAVAAAALLVALALPLPRPGLDARATVRVEQADGGVRVRARVSPPEAAEGARWFQTIAWQGNGFQRAEMIPTDAPGDYVSDRAVPATGNWKTMLRLHKGAAMVAIPIWLPADAEIGARQVAAVDKTMPFLTEQRYLLREQKGGPPWLALGVYIILGLISIAWMASFVLAARSISVKSPVRPALV